MLEKDLVALAEDAPSIQGKTHLERLKDALLLLHVIADPQELSWLEPENAFTGASGIYFPQSDDGLLVLVGKPDKDSLIQEYVIAHEYTHSFQDEAFDLNGLFQTATQIDAEYSMTVPCTSEGDAQFTARSHMNEKYSDGWAIGEGQLPTTPSSGPRVPRNLGLYGGFLYSVCVGFVATVFDARGWEGVNQIYKNLPVSTEQIIHPDKYLRGERPTGLQPFHLALGDAWTRDEVIPFGELDVLIHLGSLSDKIPPSAASGWGAGWLSIYSRPAADSARDIVVHLSLEWDTPEDAGEFQTHYLAGLKEAGMTGLPTASSGNSLWTWTGQGEFGKALWTGGERRVEIVLGTEQSSLDSALPLLAQTADQLSLLGNVALAKEEWDEAFAYYERALSLDPTLHRVYFARAGAHARRGDFQSAVAEMTSALAIAPDEAMYWWRRGEWRHQIQEYDGAVSDFTRALQLWTEAANISATGLAYAGRGLALAELGRNAEAIADLEIALQTMTDVARRPVVSQKLEQLLKLQ